MLQIWGSFFFCFLQNGELGNYFFTICKLFLLFFTYVYNR